MKLSGFLDVLRALAAAGLRKLIAVPLWFAEALAIGADCTDPAMPETIWRPREWLWRLWPRWRPSSTTQPPR
ncbi:UNVERIFIED_CONTAM: hypothetical protein Q9R58_17770 [Methylobacteriaceae bacterium AG10]|nr:hypothetical protein [Methylobacteriaceae bacterium AG10]